MPLRAELQAKITPNLSFCALSGDAYANPLNTITNFARILRTLSRAELVHEANRPVDTTLPGDIPLQLRGAIGWHLVNHLAKGLTRPSERYLLAAVINRSHPHAGGVAFSTFDDYNTQITSKTGKTFQRDAYTCYVKSPIHRAFFQTEKAERQRVKSTHRHTLRDDALRLLMFYRRAVLMGLYDDLDALVAWGLKYFLGVGMGADLVEKSTNPARKPENPARNFENPAHKAVSFKEFDQNNTSAGGLMAFNTLLAAIRGAQLAKLENERAVHRRNQAAAELRRKAERLNLPRRPAQRDINAVSQPDSTIPDGFRGVGEPDPAFFEPQTAVPVAELSQIERDLYQHHRAAGTLRTMNSYILNRCRAAGLECQEIHDDIIQNQRRAAPGDERGQRAESCTLPRHV